MLMPSKTLKTADSILYSSSVILDIVMKNQNSINLENLIELSLKKEGFQLDLEKIIYSISYLYLIQKLEYDDETIKIIF